MKIVKLILTLTLLITVINCKKEKDDNTLPLAALAVAANQQTNGIQATHIAVAKIKENSSGKYLANVIVNFTHDTTSKSLSEIMAEVVSSQVTTDNNGQLSFYMSGYTVTVKVKKADGTEYIGAATLTPDPGGGFPTVTHSDGSEFTLELISYKLYSETETETAPSDLVYSGSPYTFTRSQAITTITPTVTGTVTSCTASPTLPSGLSLDTSTCAISGTPTVSQSATSYTITATNSGGSTTASISIKVEGIYWEQEAYIKSVNAGAKYFGFSVALSKDTIAVGASSEKSSQTTIINGTTASDDTSLTGVGAVYIYKRTGNNWTQEAYIKAINASEGDSFGYSLALEGDTLVVDGFKESSNQTTITNGTTASNDNSISRSGAVYVYKRTGTTWEQEAYIKAANAEEGDIFGYPVAISKDTIAVGAFNESSNQTTITNGTTASGDNSASKSGAVYVYKRTGTTWAQEAYIKAANADASDSFGNSLAIDLDTISVGANNESSNQTTITNGTTASSDNSTSRSGAVYVYKRNGTTWTQEAYIKAANADASDSFGNSLALDSDTLVVGSYYEDSNQTTITNGTTASTDNSALDSGAVYVYKRSGTTWAQEAYLKATNAEANDNFGNSVAIDADKLVVGAWYEDSNQTTITNGTTASGDNSTSGAGAVYVYKRSGTTWTQEAYLKAPNPDGEIFMVTAGDVFGHAVDIESSSDTIVVGANGEASNQTTITNGTTASSDNSTPNNGAVYVFRKK